MNRRPRGWRIACAVCCCVIAAGVPPAAGARASVSATSLCQGLPWHDDATVRYLPAGDVPAQAVVLLHLPFADADRALRASAAPPRRRVYDKRIGTVLVPERGNFKIEAGPSAPGQSSYLLDPEVSGGERLEVAHWRTDDYTVNGKPAELNSHFVVSLRSLGPRQTELGVSQTRILLFTGRRVDMNVHTFEPYLHCRRRQDSRPVVADIEAVSRWAKDAVYAAPR